jgi:hypothetical protein
VAASAHKLEIANRHLRSRQHSAIGVSPGCVATLGCYFPQHYEQPLITNEHAVHHISMRSRNALNSADPVDASAQSDLICAPRLMIIEDCPIGPIW